MGSIIYTSEDADAPELRPIDGSLIEVLKKCLIEGYGEKEPLGWTIEYEDTGSNKIVFRMPDGTKTFVQISDGGTAAGKMYAEINCYETMNSVDNGIHPIIPLTETIYKYLKKSNIAEDSPRKWMIIGDKSGIYLGVNPYVLPGEEPIYEAEFFMHITYIGDYIPYRQEDKNTFCLLNVTRYSTKYSYLGPSNALTVITEHRVMRDIDDEKGSVNAGLGSSTSYSSYSFGNNVDMSPLAGRWLYLPVTIHTINAILGSLPGLQHPLHKFPMVFDKDNFKTFYETSGGSVTGISVATKNSSNGTNPQRILLTIGEGFRNAR